MPYQIGQAAKTEQALAIADAGLSLAALAGDIAQKQNPNQGVNHD
jgi:hypothetical protein